MFSVVRTTIIIATVATKLYVMGYLHLRSRRMSGVCITLLIIISAISAFEPDADPEVLMESKLKRVRRSSDEGDGSFSWQETPRLDTRVLNRDNDFMQRRRKKCNNRIQIANGRRRILEQGSLVRFRCEYGYILFGASVAACVRGEWSEPPPVCISAGCRRPQLPQGIIGRPLFGGAAIVFECFPGYEMEGESTLVCNGLRWNGTVPICKRIPPSTTPLPSPTKTSFAPAKTITTTTTTTTAPTSSITATNAATFETSAADMNNFDNTLSFAETNKPDNEESSETEVAQAELLETSTQEQLLDLIAAKATTDSHVTTMQNSMEEQTDFSNDGDEMRTTEAAGTEKISMRLNLGTSTRSPETTPRTSPNFRILLVNATIMTTRTTPKPHSTTVFTISSASTNFLPIKPVFTTRKSQQSMTVVTTSSSPTISSTMKPLVTTRKSFVEIRQSNVTTGILRNMVTTTGATVQAFNTTKPVLLTTIANPTTTRQPDTTTSKTPMTFEEALNNVTNSFSNSTRTPAADAAAKGAVILCAYMFRTRKQHKQLRECLHYHLNTTVATRSRTKPTRPVWRNRFDPRQNLSRPTFSRNSTRFRIPAKTSTKPPLAVTTLADVDMNTTAGIGMITENSSTALTTTDGTTSGENRMSVIPTPPLDPASIPPTDEFDNTIEQVLRKNHVQREEKREFITPFKLDTGSQGTEPSKGINMLTTLTTLMTLVVIGMLGVVFYYCWRRNKGIARRSRYESDGRNLSVHLDLDEEFVYFGNNR